MRKFTKKKNRIIFGTVFAGLSVALVAGLIVGDVIALGKYASVLESAFGNTGRKYTEVHYDGVDPIYYEREYSDEELLEAQQEFALNTGREGMVLLEEGNLPYAENTKISLFSKSSVDFIFGGADALFEDVEIISNEPGYVSAPSGKKEDIGFIFSSCRFLSEDLEEGSVYLMRPWRPEGKAAFRKCTYDSHINAAGFSPWHGLEGEAPLASFRVDDDRFSADYMSDGIDADVKALLGRFNA